MSALRDAMIQQYRAAKALHTSAREMEYAAELALLEATGRGASLRAQWVRAFRRDEHEECHRLIATEEWGREPLPDADIPTEPDWVDNKCLTLGCRNPAEDSGWCGLCEDARQDAAREVEAP
jgi:hypothetical protein